MAGSTPVVKLQRIRRHSVTALALVAVLAGAVWVTHSWRSRQRWSEAGRRWNALGRCFVGVEGLANQDPAARVRAIELAVALERRRGVDQDWPQRCDAKNASLSATLRALTGQRTADSMRDLLARTHEVADLENNARELWALAALLPRVTSSEKIVEPPPPVVLPSRPPGRELAFDGFGTFEWERRRVVRIMRGNHLHGLRGDDDLYCSLDRELRTMTCGKHVAPNALDIPDLPASEEWKHLDESERLDMDIRNVVECDHEGERRILGIGDADSKLWVERDGHFSSFPGPPYRMLPHRWSDGPFDDAEQVQITCTATGARIGLPGSPKAQPPCSRSRSASDCIPTRDVSVFDCDGRACTPSTTTTPLALTTVIPLRQKVLVLGELSQAIAFVLAPFSELGTAPVQVLLDEKLFRFPRAFHIVHSENAAAVVVALDLETANPEPVWRGLAAIRIDEDGTVTPVAQR